MSIRTSTLVAACLCSGAAFVPTTQAATIDPGLIGVTSHDGWNGLTTGNHPGYGGFPGSAPWPAPIVSNLGSGDAELNKVSNGVSGGPYPAGSSLYFGSFSSGNIDGGTLSVTDDTVVAGLSNVVFQVEIGEAAGYDFFNDVLPALSYTTASGTAGLAASLSGIIDRDFNGTVNTPAGPQDVYINTYLLQWNLSAVTEAITDIAIQFTGVPHAQVHALRLDQSDTFAGLNVSFVPEPASLALMGIGGVLLIRRPRKALNRV